MLKNLALVRKGLVLLGIIVVFPLLMAPKNSYSGTLVVKGAVNKEVSLSLDDFKKMDSFHANDVPLLREKKDENEEEAMISKNSYRGVLLRDILEKAGMRYIRKWEPGVYVRVRGSKNKEVIFSFGEIFYSSIGRSILLAYEKNGDPIEFPEGCGELIVANDIREGRRISGVKEIIVERVNIELKAYDDKAKKITRPPTTEFSLVNNVNKKSVQMKLKDLKEVPSMVIPAAIMVGDCEGFHGVFSFEGVPLAALLKKVGISIYDLDYSHYAVISSEDGFCATVSFGELFNSRLGNNIIIAYKKDGEALSPKEGFAVSVAGEDSTGGRSIKRINKIEIF